MVGAVCDVAGRAGHAQEEEEEEEEEEEKEKEKEEEEEEEEEEGGEAGGGGGGGPTAILPHADLEAPGCDTSCCDKTTTNTRNQK